MAAPPTIRHVRNMSASYVLYEPGGDGLSFVKELQPGTNDKMPLSFCQKIVLAINDCLNSRADELGFDGMFFLGRSALHVPHISTWTENRGLTGPQLFFAEFTRSELERQQWKEADVLQKLRLSCYFYKHPCVNGSAPVLPIWTIRHACMYELVSTYHYFDAGITHSRMTSWVKEKDLGTLRPEDPSRLDGNGKTIGIWLDMLDSGAILLPAEEMRMMATQATAKMGLYQLIRLLRSAARITPTGQWYRNLPSPEGDQIEKIIRYAGEYMDEHPEELITYQKARSWNNGLGFDVHKSTKVVSKKGGGGGDDGSPGDDDDGGNDGNSKATKNKKKAPKTPASNKQRPHLTRTHKSKTPRADEEGEGEQGGESDGNDQGGQDGSDDDFEPEVVVSNPNGGGAKRGRSRVRGGARGGLAVMNATPAAAKSTGRRGSSKGRGRGKGRGRAKTT